MTWRRRTSSASSSRPRKQPCGTGRTGCKQPSKPPIRDVRPVGVFPDVVEADQVFVGVQAEIVTTGTRVAGREYGEHELEPVGAGAQGPARGAPASRRRPPPAGRTGPVGCRHGRPDVRARVTDVVTYGSSGSHRSSMRRAVDGWRDGPQILGADRTSRSAPARSPYWSTPRTCCRSVSGMTPPPLPSR